jgi:sialate O-acetylesterase
VRRYFNYLQVYNNVAVNGKAGGTMARFKTAAVFSSHMVLQRDKNIKVFGQGENDTAVTVSFRGENYECRIQDETWEVLLPQMPAGNGYEMTIRCKEEEKRFNNIAIGEVWLAGGQSNMELELQNCKGGKQML